jgi:hypothetical protein
VDTSESGERTIPKFSDFANDRKHMIGEKVNLKEILDVPIVVLDFKTDKSKFKPESYTAIQFYRVGESEQHVVFTGATVLREQLNKYKDNLPFETTIRKIGKFYSFT